MPRRSILTALMLAPLLVAPAGSAAAAPLPAVGPPTPASAVPTPSNDYRIGVDDTLEVSVYQAPDLSRTVQVDSGGGFELPLIGRVAAVGRTAREVEVSLTSELGGRYLRNPVVTVLVKQAVSRRVTVDGAVVQPGVYSLSGPTTLLQAIALAHGADPRLANLHKVTIFRTVGGAERTIVFNLAEIRSGKQLDPEVRSNDVVVVDTSGPKSFFSLFGSALPALALLRP